MINLSRIVGDNEKIPDATVVVLREWWLAHHFAEENSRLLIENSSEETSNLCAKRMCRCDRADAALFRLETEIPPILALYMEVSKDKGCQHCWFSSNPNDKHPDCTSKIARWFGYRDALMAYIHEVYIRLQVEVKE
jgi:hypothetical protein